MEQRDVDALALEAAYEQATESGREGGIPIGAALAAPDGSIVARGHNLRVQSGDPTAHAETVCFRAAGRRRDWPALTLASTLSPCAMCTGTAVLYRVRRVVVGEHRTFLGREGWLREAGIELVLADDPRCVALMREFIAASPDLWREDIGEPAV